MKFNPVEELSVNRTLSDGAEVAVGIIAQNNNGCYFQYADSYLAGQYDLSPFKLSFDPSVQKAPQQPHGGLHGVFADALPDGWGMLLMDRVFRQHGITPNQLTPLDRLAYIGDTGMGALSFSPLSSYHPAAYGEPIDLAKLGLEAQAVFEGSTTEVLAQLANAGGSGGARPKAQLYLNPDNPKQATTTAPRVYQKSDDSHQKSRQESGQVSWQKTEQEPWLVKFTSASLPLAHEEGLCEAVYLTLAKQAGIEVPEWQLLPAPEESGAKAWLAVKRFDCTVNPSKRNGRLHMHSIGGLLDADYRLPSLDYGDLIKASSLLCKSPAVGQTQFRRAIFNLFALNQDDHAKNWAFLQSDDGSWSPAPFYDVTHSPNPHHEHSTAFMGHGKKPPLKAMQKLAAQANFGSWKAAQVVIEEVVEALSYWDHEAKQLGVSAETRRTIGKALEKVRSENTGLLKL